MTPIYPGQFKWLKLGKFININKAIENVDISYYYERKFMSHFDDTFVLKKKTKGPDYIVIDNFIETFGLEMNDLLVARNEAD